MKRINLIIEESAGILGSLANVNIRVLVMAFAISLFTVSCGDDKDDDGNATVGLTVQNPPSVTDEVCIWVYDFSDPVTNLTQWMQWSTSGGNSDIIASGSVPEGSGAKAWAPVPLGSQSGSAGQRFTGSGAYLVEVSIENSTSANRFFSQVQFTSGSATIDWASASFDFDNQGSASGGTLTVSGYSGDANLPVYAHSDAGMVSIASLTLSSAGIGMIGGDGKISWSKVPNGSFTVYIVKNDQSLFKTSSPVTLANGAGTVAYSAFVAVTAGGDGTLTEAGMVGTWIYTYMFPLIVYEFYADKTGYTYKPIPIIGGRDDEEDFTWSIEDDKILTSLGDSFTYINATKIVRDDDTVEFIKQ
jgi:hypothetical protein